MKDIKIFLKNMIVNFTKIFEKMKSKSLVSIEKIFKNAKKRFVIMMRQNFKLENFPLL